MRSLVCVAFLLAVGLTVAFAGAADEEWIDCEGSDGSFRIPRTTSCAQYADYLTPSAEARAKWDWLGKDAERARRFIDEDLSVPEDPEEFGSLYGLIAWACANGYTKVNECGGGYWERVEPAGSGYGITVWVEGDSQYGTSFHGTNTVERTILLTKSAQTMAGEMDVHMNFTGAVTIDPKTYAKGDRALEESLARQVPARVEAARDSAMAYCREYREAFRQALQALVAGGTLPDSKKEEEKPKDETATLAVRASAEGHLTASTSLDIAPSAFSRLVVSGAVVDDLGKPIAGASVRVVPVGRDVETDAGGAFCVEVAGSGSGSATRTVTLRLVRPRIEVHGDPTPDGDVEVLGVAADGVSTLTLSVSAVGVRPETVAVRPPRLGELAAPSPLGFVLVLDSSGRGRLDYKPPAYLDANDLERALPVHRYDGASPVWAAVVPLVFEYEDADGNPGRASVDVLAVRPPVMLVHGFLGGAETWARFAGHLREHKYDGVVSEYFTRGTKDDSIPAQSKLLGEYIEGQVRDYARAGIVLARVDVVAHSMGGLISRYYAETMAATNVRKILMVGTPNHGVSYISTGVGALGSSWLEQHGTAGDQLYCGSAFLADLNGGEAEGRHLAASVQYANLIGLRPSIASAFGVDGTAPTDGVVDAASAHLNGVLEWKFPGMTHSTMLEPLAPSITEALAVWTKLRSLLLEDIPRAPLDNARVELRQSEGRVEVARGVEAKSWRRVKGGSQALGTATPVRTGRDGRAVIGLYLKDVLWGTIQLLEETEVTVLYASPERVHVYVASGTARLTTPSGAGHFEALLGADGRGRWYEVRPRAIVRSLGTDCAVSVGKEISVDVLEGAISLESADDSAGAWGVTVGQRIEVSRSGEIRSRELSERPPWTETSAPPHGCSFSWWGVFWILLGLAVTGVLVAAALGY
ncbi:MAG: alpha/beta fold hydrolase [Candidatus Bipolaricaulis sp.]|nr:alpha/beta fold hydrolase [Candidatus Bipolaricaulis sp.]